MNQRHKILIVDDEEALREVIGELLSDYYEPMLASNGHEAVLLARKERPALILLDLWMPGMDGIATCDLLRQNPVTRQIPIIMLTAANESNHRVRAFDAGADDFVTKPFEATELLSRIRSKLRRSQETQISSSTPVTNGSIVVDPLRFEVSVAGRIIPTTSVEFELLKLFVFNSERVVTRQEIVNAVWNNPETPSRIIDAHIVAIRKKLSGSGLTLKTVYGKGYILEPVAPKRHFSPTASL